MDEPGNDRGRGSVYRPYPPAMDTVLIFIQDRLDRFEKWFNDRFGWFFTNGMKDRRARKPRIY